MFTLRHAVLNICHCIYVLGATIHRDDKIQPNVVARNAAPPLSSAAIDRSKWNMTCGSVKSDSNCSLMIDGDNGSFWSTEDGADLRLNITVDMGASYLVNGVSMLPEQTFFSWGWIANHVLRLSSDGRSWTQVAFGLWDGGALQKYINIEPRQARYVQLSVLSTIGPAPYVHVAEFNVYQAQNSPQVGSGRWGQTIDLPLVPVAAAVNPINGQVVLWSSFSNDAHDGSPNTYTQTATYDPATGTVQAQTISQTNHDMFCPGISMDFNGQIIVTGGNSASKTSIYNIQSSAWTTGPDMNVARGYQSSTTTSDGRTFVIGGSFSGGVDVFKNGEILDRGIGAWSVLPGALAQPIMTSDTEGQFRSDNHAWIFAWKNGSVFQGGPSKQMHWYDTTTTNGSITAAGLRANDADAMCGDATMFDAVAGKILAVGGSPNYENSPATAASHVITLNNPLGDVTVVPARNGMASSRIFHTSTILADGTVFVAGGQQFGQLFYDTTPVLTPEIYVPASDSFVPQTPNSIVRVYHSFSVLLPDATVLNGGGGLCGWCYTNHFDAQIFTPQYLLQADGSPATRPKFKSISATSVQCGQTLTFRTNTRVTQASLIRYGTSTHTVNTDQRRVPLPLTALGFNSYTVSIPKEPGVALPGYWMLFVLNAAGVPSVAQTIQVLPP